MSSVAAHDALIRLTKNIEVYQKRIYDLVDTLASCAKSNNKLRLKLVILKQDLDYLESEVDKQK